MTFANTSDEGIGCDGKVEGDHPLFLWDGDELYAGLRVLPWQSVLI